MNKKASLVILSSLLSLSLFSCDNSMMATITFDFSLSGGSFPGANLTTLEGRPGDKLYFDQIPEPVLNGYRFVSWLTLRGNKYEAIKYQVDPDDQNKREYTSYPYGKVTWYAYFEPELTLSFDLGDGVDNGKIIAPVNVLDDGAFDSQDNTLNGYTTLSIPSVDYLPTATADNMTFQYWYTEYPLMAKADEKTGMTHFVLDTTAEKGEYRFDTGFATAGILGSGMEFPKIDGENLTLYAKWQEDPYVLIHYGLEGVEDDVAYVEKLSDGSFETPAQAVLSAFEETLGIDLTDDGEKTIQDGAKRFAGLYLDEEFTEGFAINETTPISGNVLDIYVKWDDRLDLSFDYGDGLVDGKDREEIDGQYYVGDVLGQDFLAAHSPSKENSTFVGYQLNGEQFDIVSTPLPKPDDGSSSLHFTASFDDYPELSLVLNYPGSKEDVSLFPSYFQAGTSIETIVRNAIGEIEDGYAFAGLTSVPTSEVGKTEPEEFGLLFMPEEDTTLYVNIGYPLEVNVHDCFGVYGGSYTQDAADVTKHLFGASLDSEGNFVPQSFDVSTLRYSEESREWNGLTYFFDGLFLDDGFQTPFILGASSISTEAPVVMDVYQKFTEGITLELVDDNDVLGSFEVLPNSRVDDSFYEKVQKVLPEFTPEEYDLYIVVDGEDYLLQTFLPTTDQTIVVHKKA